MVLAGISTGEKKSNGAAAAAAAPNSGQAVESGTPLDVHVKANGLHDVDDTDSFGKGPAGPAMHAAAALPPCGKLCCWGTYTIYSFCGNPVCLDRTSPGSNCATILATFPCLQ